MGAEGASSSENRRARPVVAADGTVVVLVVRHKRETSPTGAVLSRDGARGKRRATCAGL